MDSHCFDRDFLMVLFVLKHPKHLKVEGFRCGTFVVLIFAAPAEVGLSLWSDLRHQDNCLGCFDERFVQAAGQLSLICIQGLLFFCSKLSDLGDIWPVRLAGVSSP